MKTRTRRKKRKEKQEELAGEMIEKARAWDYWCEHASWCYEDGQFVIYTGRLGNYEMV